MPRLQLEPQRLAFDIDGVVADIMSAFLRLAAERHQICHLRYEDITDFDLCSCLQLAEEVVADILNLLLQLPQELPVAPLPGAVPVLTQLGREHPLLFVTARDQAAPISQWLSRQLPAVPPANLRVIATGDPDKKIYRLQEQGIKFFVEDRLETCFQLAQYGIQPLVFDQPWNRRPHPFPILHSWQDLAQLLEPAPR